MADEEKKPYVVKLGDVVIDVTPPAGFKGPYSVELNKNGNSTDCFISSENYSEKFQDRSIAANLNGLSDSQMVVFGNGGKVVVAIPARKIKHLVNQGEITALVSQGPENYTYTGYDVLEAYMGKLLNNPKHAPNFDKFVEAYPIEFKSASAFEQMGWLKEKVDEANKALIEANSEFKAGNRDFQEAKAAKEELRNHSSSTPHKHHHHVTHNEIDVPAGIPTKAHPQQSTSPKGRN